MFNFGFGWGHGLIAVIEAFASGLIALLAFIVIVGLVFLLVRFLLVATRAAQLYVAKHEPPRPAAPPAPVAAQAPAAASSAPATAPVSPAPAAATPPATIDPAPKPASKDRTPKKSPPKS